MDRTALILGASGRFGRNAAAAFEAVGWQVRRFDRQRDDLRAAAEGAAVIVNGWNPAYPDWAAQVPGQTRALIEVAEATGARVIVPGNVYVFGAGAPEVLGTGTPHAATNPLGRIRVEMEAVWRASKARVTILRAGDFIDTGPSGNWFDKVLVAKLGRGVFTYPGPTDRVHAWAWLPDVTRAAAALAERGDALGRFVDLPFPGYSVTGAQMHSALERATGRSLALKRMGWAPVRAMGLVSPMMRGLLEMRYLWSMPHRLDDGPFRAALPGFRDTPLEAALRSAVGHQIEPHQAVARRPTLYVGHARIV